MEYFSGDYAEFSSVDNGNLISNNNNNNNGVHFTVDDLLDFSKEDETMTDAFFDILPGNSGDSSTVTAVDSCNSSVSGGGEAQFNGNVSCRSFSESQFSGNELCVPYDDLAELEWLSNFVEESFSTDDVHLIPTTKAVAAAKSMSADTSSSAITTDSPPPPFFPIRRFCPRQSPQQALTRASMRLVFPPPPRLPLAGPQNGTVEDKRAKRNSGAEMPPLRIGKDTTMENGSHGAENSVQRLWGSVQVWPTRARVPARFQPDIHIG